MTLNKLLGTALVATSLLVTPFALQASEHGEHDKSAMHDSKITEQEAIDIALKDMPGEVVETEHERKYWEVKIRNDQDEVYEYKIDVNSGEILKKKKKH